MFMKETKPCGFIHDQLPSSITSHWWACGLVPCSSSAFQSLHQWGSHPSLLPGWPWRQGQATGVALTQAFAGALRGRPPPRPVIEERQALLTVNSVCVMFAIAHQFVKFILYTLTGMSVTLTPGKRRGSQQQDHCKVLGTTQRECVYKKPEAT